MRKTKNIVWLFVVTLIIGIIVLPIASYAAGPATKTPDIKPSGPAAVKDASFGSAIINIIDSQGKTPINGVNVTLNSTPGYGHFKATTDAIGRAIFNNMQVGDYSCSLEPPLGYNIDSSSGCYKISITSGGVATQTVVMMRTGYSAIIKVISPSRGWGEDLIEKALVSVLVGPNQSIIRETNSMGETHFDNLRPLGSYTFTASVKGYADGSITLVIPNLGAATGTISLKPIPGSVYMTVMEFMGGPIRGAIVTVPVTFPNGTTVLSTSDPTNADGKTTFKNMPPGSYKFTVSAQGQGYLDETAIITVPSANATFLLQIGGQAEITVFNPDGSVRPNCLVRADGNGKNVKSQTDNMGKVTFSLPIGTYDFFAGGHGRKLTVKKGETVKASIEY